MKKILAILAAAVAAVGCYAGDAVSMVNISAVGVSSAVTTNYTPSSISGEIQGVYVTATSNGYYTIILDTVAFGDYAAKAVLRITAATNTVYYPSVTSCGSSYAVFPVVNQQIQVRSSGAGTSNQTASVLIYYKAQ